MAACRKAVASARARSSEPSFRTENRLAALRRTPSSPSSRQRTLYPTIAPSARAKAYTPAGSGSRSIYADLGELGGHAVGAGRSHFGSRPHF
jgi:hypothetical protein